MRHSPSGIALRRLARVNELLLEIVTEMYDEQASHWPSPTAPSVKWHLWHVSRWSDIVQSALLPVANSESDLSNKGPELWDALAIPDEWEFQFQMPGKLGTGTGSSCTEAAALPLPGLVRIVWYARSTFELCEMRYSQIDEGMFESDFFDWDGVRIQIGDAMFGHVGHLSRHLGMIEALKGVLGEEGSATG